MAALSWLLNLDFAGGGEVLPPEPYKVLHGTLMSSMRRILKTKKKRSFINNKFFYKKLFGVDGPIQEPFFNNIVKYNYSILNSLTREDQNSVENQLDNLIEFVPSSKIIKTNKFIEQSNNLIEFKKVKKDKKELVPVKKKLDKFEDQLHNLIKFQRSKNNKKKSVTYFDVNSRHRTVSLF